MTLGRARIWGTGKGNLENVELCNSVTGSQSAWVASQLLDLSGVQYPSL